MTGAPKAAHGVPAIKSNAVMIGAGIDGNVSVVHFEAQVAPCVTKSMSPSLRMKNVTCWINSSRLFALGWKPEVDLERGIALACDDFRKRF